MKLVFASNNAHKLDEIRKAVGSGFEITGLRDMNIVEEIPETRDTLEGNAIQKAEYIVTHYNLDCFADDTGLEVEALDNRPGVYSARYAGEGCSFADNVNKLLQEMDGKQNRKARFRTVIAFAYQGTINTFEGVVEGVITEQAMGKEGFGYDPVFRPVGFDKTFAEMPMSLKNTISHRGKAVKLFTEYLKNNFTLD